MLIYGPEYSSAVCWARDNPGVAEVINTEDPSGYWEILQRLKAVEHRRLLAVIAQEVGQKYFSNKAVVNVFLYSVSSSEK